VSHFHEFSELRFGTPKQDSEPETYVDFRSFGTLLRHLDAGSWQNETIRKTNRSGRLSMPGVPGGTKRGWAFRILRVGDK
jgi:hypothetical protein